MTRVKRLRTRTLGNFGLQNFVMCPGWVSPDEFMAAAKRDKFKITRHFSFRKDDEIAYLFADKKRRKGNVKFYFYTEQWKPTLKKVTLCCWKIRL